MKKRILTIILLAFVGLMSTGCITLLAAALATEEEDAALVFVDDSVYSIDVIIDGQRHYVKTVKERDLNRKRNLKHAADNMIYVSPGRHDIIVKSHGSILYDERINLRSDETKLIYL